MFIQKLEDRFGSELRGMIVTARIENVTLGCSPGHRG